MVMKVHETPAMMNIASRWNIWLEADMVDPPPKIGVGVHGFNSINRKVHSTQTWDISTIQVREGQKKKAIQRTLMATLICGLQPAFDRVATRVRTHGLRLVSMTGRGLPGKPTRPRSQDLREPFSDM